MWFQQQLQAQLSLQMLCCIVHTVENDSFITKLFVSLLLILNRKSPLNFYAERSSWCLTTGSFCCGDSHSYNYVVVQQWGELHCNRCKVLTLLAMPYYNTYVTAYINYTKLYDCTNNLLSVSVPCTDIWVVAISDENSFGTTPDW